MVIAELGVNHDGSVDTAMSLVAAARRAGVDAVKVQWFHPERLLSAEARLAAYQSGQAKSVHELLAGLSLGVDAMRRVRDVARDAGLAFIVTPFSLDDVAEVAAMEPDAVKIASPDAVNTPLLAAAAELGRPMLISTGACELDELDAAGELLARHVAGGCLLQCVSSYPAPCDDAALGGIGVLVERFGLPVGYSDHTTETITGALAVAAGACVLEKHLTHDRSAAGPDHAASLEPDALARYVALARQAATMLGPRAKTVRACERDVRLASRQSVAARRDLPAGATLRLDDLTTMRPGTGLPAARLADLVGRTLARPAAARELLTADHLRA